MLFLSKIIDWTGNLVFITAPSLGFLPQLLKKDITFAPILSTILIFANIFKLFYLNVTQIQWEVFFQSVFLIVFHFVLISYSRPDKLSILEEKIFVNKYTEKSYRKYGLFSLIFSLFFITNLTLLLLNYLFVGLLWISCPLFIVLECSVGIVQLIILEMESRFTLNKTASFPKELFLMWALGDLLKLAWMIKLQGDLLICASIAVQIVVDLAVVYRYGDIGKK